jgi:hypothetical protein
MMAKANTTLEGVPSSEEPEAARLSDLEEVIENYQESSNLGLLEIVK